MRFFDDSSFDVLVREGRECNGGVGWVGKLGLVSLFVFFGVSVAKHPRIMCVYV